MMSETLKACCCCLVLLAVIAWPIPAQAADGSWKLVWSDEFTGEKLDYSKWGIEVNAFGGGNNELQLFTDRAENVRVEQGHLVIEARKDKPNIQGTIREYSSGRVRTKHRGDWKYARIEVRAKLPQGKGLWPAIWMLPTEEKYGPWAASGEIDIMELVGHEPGKVLGTLHYGGVWPKNQHAGSSHELPQGTFADDFHTFAIEWEQGEIRWYVDDKLYQTQTKWQSQSADFPAPFDQAFHLILNLSIGGNLPGPPNANTKFPQQMRVDYVRVYQKG
jgi:beta-glucanase (GH16 family)